MGWDDKSDGRARFSHAVRHLAAFRGRFGISIHSRGTSASVFCRSLYIAVSICALSFVLLRVL